MSRPLTCKRRRRVRELLPPVCVQCGATTDLTIDHRIPRVYGGTNQLANLQILCLPCNRMKAKGEVRHWNPAKNQQKGQALAAALGASTPAPKAP